MLEAGETSTQLQQISIKVGGKFDHRLRKEWIFFWSPSTKFSEHFLRLFVRTLLHGFCKYLLNHGRFGSRCRYNVWRTVQLCHKYICLHSSLYLSSFIYIPPTENCVWQTIKLPKISFPVVSEIVFSLTDFESIFYVIGCFNFVRWCQFLFIIKFSVMIGAVYLSLLAVESQCLFLKFPPGVMKVRKHLVN